MPEPPPPPKAARSGLRGGSKYRRRGASRQRVHSPPLAIPADAALTKGYRFPATPATRAQVQALRAIVDAYLRRDFMLRNDRLPAATLARTLRVTERQARNYRTDALELGHSPGLQLVVDVLHGMHLGRIAGVLGTPKTDETRWVFCQVWAHTKSAKDLPGWRFTFEDAAAWRMWMAAFREDYRTWQQGGGA